MAQQNTPADPLLISYMTLRKAVGFLGISIPAIMIMGTMAFGGCTHIQNSISHYYYTIMGDVFVGMLCATGIFLITYKGYDLRDNIVSFIAGAAIISVALFPTSPNPDLGCVTRTLSNTSWRTTTHYISAAVFYVMLAYISLFLFTKTSGGITPPKAAAQPHLPHMWHHHHYCHPPHTRKGLHPRPGQARLQAHLLARMGRQPCLRHLLAHQRRVHAKRQRIER